MGSVCCTASRSRHMAEASDGWSTEHTTDMNVGVTHEALSPPLVSSHWERKPHFSELAASHDGMLLRRTVSSSNRSGRSNSISSESRTTSSHRRCETADGLLGVFNSPSEGFCYVQRSLDHLADPVTLPSDFLRKNSAALSSQEESGSSGSSAVSSRAMEEFDYFPFNRPARNFPTFNISKSRQGMESSKSFEVDLNANEVTATRFHSYQKMLRNTVDVPSSFSRQKSGSWRSRGFSEYVDPTDPRSSRWSSMGSPSNMITEREPEDFNELYIRSTSLMHTHHPSTQVESPMCGLCAKAISQKSLWSFPRALGSKDLPVVGILECGHVYHAECLDQATPHTQAHDPPCPKCEVKRDQAKLQEEGPSKSRTRERSYVKGKLSRVGVSLEKFDDAELSKSSQPIRHQCGLIEGSSRKGSLHLTAHNADKAYSAKSLLRKQFSFRGKVSREATSNGFGAKRPGYATRVSPENSTREDDYMAGRRVL